ncbi:MAG: large conductance mechanosensitive channel protein MscL [Lachnospiraceae bacterium]|nr:large conductance mechanosensitive channel protein MscL [Lachnospiraceae bacterium]
MGKFMKEFKEFALKGNVMDMAIGVIIGAAFGNIVTALTNSFVNPLISVFTGGVQKDENGVMQVVGGSFEVNGVAFDYGAFISAVINFLIIALILFIMLKAINGATEKAKKLAKKKEEEAPAPEDPADIKLMKEMLAIMKAQDPEAAKKAEESLKK